ncbi:MAG: hypothetical protein EAZ55_07155 [Cytophagales bacterium]|nr:MAG: hypothetical protein EAZ55_07155 [Cytophagales bacterium]
MSENINKLFKGTIIYGLGAALNKGLSVLLTPLFTAYLNPEDYAIFAVLNFFSVILSTIFLFGFGSSIGLCYYENELIESKKRVIWTSFTILFITSILMFCVFYLTIPLYNDLLFKNSSQYDFIFITIVSTVFINITTPLTLYLQFEQKQYQYVMITLVTTISSILLRLILIVYLDYGISGLIIGNLFACVVQFLITFMWIVKDVKFVFSKSISKKLFAYGLPLIPSFFILLILQQGNIYLLEHFTNNRALGLYSVGFAFGSFITLVTNAIATAWFPYAMSFTQNKEEARITFGRIISYYTISVGTLSLLFYVFDFPLVYLLTNEKFWDARYFIGGTATVSFISLYFNFLLAPMYFEKETRYVSLIQLIATIIYFLLAILLIPSIGSIGTMISLVFGYLAMIFILHLWNLMKKTQYLQIKYEGKRLFIFTILYLIFVIIHYIFNNFAVSCFSFLLFSIGIFQLINKDEKNYIKLYFVGFKNKF